MEFINQLLSAKVVWFLIGLVLFISEFMSPGVLIMVFFGIGAWVVCILLFIFNPSLNLQLLVFVVTSALSLFLLRKYFKEHFFGVTADVGKQDEIMEEFVGKHALVEIDITPPAPGKVSFRGTNWEAEAEENIPKGTTVEIVGKDSILLKVRPLIK